ncbi:HVO_0649 family zinc finger protein [Natronorubrum halophilum]|uniref:HVO_0649 family zinc finger protein n=1 Tax=Natronorubrum halophilum TaxID=1702106 RepID=UPI000EF6E81C|nr:HVO_0649 family zinc finger protein [Natronorubrum halophilum]
MSSYQSPFERLRAKFDESNPNCPSCGYVDTECGWRVATTGSRVTYQFVCPTCDAVETRELRLGREP